MEVIQFILFSFLNYNGVCGTVTLTREISCVIISGPKKHPSSALTGQMNTFVTAAGFSIMWRRGNHDRNTKLETRDSLLKRRCKRL